MSDDTQQLYQDAIKAMKAGDKETARNLLSQVVEEDEENVDAWVALSKVVDNDAERRICLTTILQLDPDNKYARKALEKSEAKLEQTKSQEEVAPGITRGMVRAASIGAAVYIIIVFGVASLLVSSINGTKASERRSATQVAANATATVVQLEANAVALAATQTQQSISATALAQSLITPSATFTRTPDARFPTWTPTATEATDAFRILDLPPANIPGVIYGWGGRDSTDSGYLDTFRLPANGVGELEEVINEFARGVTSDIPGETMMFERFNRRLEETATVILNPKDAENTITGFATLLGDAGLLDVKNPSISGDGNKFVVDALVRDTNIREVFLVDIPANQLTQLTNDAANYTSPAISQDGQRVLAVRQDSTGNDLVLIDIVTQAQVLMTNDGDAQIESQPTWHSDGLQAAYRAHPAGQPNNGEIYLLRVLPESGVSNLLIATADDETQPVFDPSSNFIAFSSNRGSGVYNVYIFDLTSLTTYQLTASEFDHFPGGWSLG